MTGAQIEEEVIATAKEVGLRTKIYDLAGKLSGGQKRKLSVGIALIGGSKVNRCCLVSDTFKAAL